MIATDGNIEIFEGDVRINLARVICTFILHIQIIPEIKCGIDLMKFVRCNPSGFYGKETQFPFLVAFMKLTAGYLTECTNVLIIV